MHQSKRSLGATKKAEAKDAKDGVLWDPFLEKNPGYEELRRDKNFTVDYSKAIQNLTDILVDSEKFEEMNRNIFLAMDEDDAGVLDCAMVEQFMRSFLRGHQVQGKPNTSFEEYHDSAYAILQEEDSGEVTPDLMAKVMYHMIKTQIGLLQENLE